MLDRTARYRVRRVAPEGRHDGGWFHATAPLFDALNDGGVEFDGAWLAQAGLPTPSARAETCYLLHLQRV
jgi:hypothetical protein